VNGSSARPENPFSSRRTRPGALPYRSSSAESLSEKGSEKGSDPLRQGAKTSAIDVPPQGRTPFQRGSETCSEETGVVTGPLIERIMARRRTAIIGPHGSGKTTLLATLCRQLESGIAPPRTLTLAFHNDQSQAMHRGRLRAALEVAQRDRIGLVIVDGYEQLRWLARCLLNRHQRRWGYHLLVTSHRPLRSFQTIHHTSAERHVAERLLAQLLERYPAQEEAITARFPAAWDRCGGDFRKLWSLLYDDFERLIGNARGRETPRENSSLNCSGR